MASVFDRLFGRRPPAPEKLPPAHRGTGGEQLTEEDTRDFLDGHFLLVASSNVAAAQWFEDSLTLQIEYLNGDAWIYGNISRVEAIDFAVAPSKGIWLWDHVRVRGTRHEHKKPATQIRHGRRS